MVMSTAPAAPNNLYYHYVPVPNPPLYYTQPQQYPTTPVSVCITVEPLYCKTPLKVSRLEEVSSFME